ncbi:hypothetical protein [Pseudomonas citronellolis]|uniref:hypothetical protein n=1 Tax=Pseudomonas citronellolis TaxID=53408 RepID=UPI001064C064|nr:hypothetical protein [Pseudomonas humi]
MGLRDEYPRIRYPEGFDSWGNPAQLEPGIALCVEAYAGAVGGKDGIKLENQLPVTETGIEYLTSYPFDQSFLK